MTVNGKRGDKRGLALADARLQRLENEHRWQLFALDLLAEMSAIHDSSEAAGDRAQILDALQSCLGQMFDLECGGLLLAAEDNTFHLETCWPGDCRERLQSEAGELIERGDFAWAMNRNYPELMSSSGGGRQLICNVVATRSEVHGMFIGLPAAGVRFSEAMKKMLAVVLHNAAYALENAALYKLVKRQRDDLEATVELRNRELEYYSRHEVLTGLANRATFLSRLDQAIEQPRGAVQVICVDADAFNRVNGSFGYQVGDRLLVELAERLKNCLTSDAVCRRLGVSAEEIVVARLGGDEFAALLPDPQCVWDQAAPLQELLDALAEPFPTGGDVVHISCSIGVASFPAHGGDARSLLDRADVALHQAKLDGIGRFASYRADMPDQRGSHSLLMESALHRALANGEFELYYQPKVDLISERITGAEALLRWHHPERGLVGPGEFIELAESSALIVPIGEWALAEVCRQQAEWQARGRQDLRICVNLSAAQIHDADLAQRFADILGDHQTCATRIELELTETAIARDVKAAVRTLGELHDLGFSIAIDDFGTGYSSLQLLRQFPLDTLKIDRSFVRDINIDPGDAAIVAAVVQMGHSLHLRVIAEGVETREQLSFLQSLGCHEVQGHYIAQPLPLAQFEALLERWQGVP